jgi:putative oxidoreductase
LAAIPVIITMAVALFLVHGGDPFPRQEKALLYGLGYLALLIGGGGSLSVMSLFRR